MTRKLSILHSPVSDSPYLIYEKWADEQPQHITSFKTEQEARDYCKARQKIRVIAEYSLDG